MSEHESYSTNDFMKKIPIVSKNIKALTDLVKTIDDKLNLVNVKVKKIWVKSLKQIIGLYEDKQKQYLDMRNKNKMKSPKQETIEYYKLFKNEEGKYEIL